jgi:hypothetical protein
MGPADPVLGKRDEQNGVVDEVGISRVSAQTSAKPASFYMSLLTLGLLSLITSWDATSLAIALPVSEITFHRLQTKLCLLGYC